MFDPSKLKKDIGNLAKDAMSNLYSVLKKVSIDSSYVGGNPQVKETDSGVDGEALPIVSSYGWSIPHLSDDALIGTLQNEQRVVTGKILNTLPAGRLDVATYWMTPVMYPASETLAGFTAAGFRLPLPFPLNVSKVVFNVTTGVGGATSRIKVFAADASALLIDTGDVDVSGTGLKETTLGANIYLHPGFYVLEYTSTSASVVVRCATLSTGASAILNQGSTVRGTNGGMGTATNNANFPMIKFVGA